MAIVAALYDSSVLYSAPVRDLLLRLALIDLFAAKWSRSIHDEWISSLLRNRRDLTRRQLERTRALMDSHVRDCLVEGFEPLIAGLDLPDPDDRHVLAAAIHAGADVIVTYNLADFPNARLAFHAIEAMHPDKFVAHWLDLAPVIVLGAVREHRASLRKPAKTAAQYLATLDRLALTRSVAMLRPFAKFI